jgi:hypothetical protein
MLIDFYLVLVWFEPNTVYELTKILFWHIRICECSFINHHRQSGRKMGCFHLLSRSTSISKSDDASTKWAAWSSDAAVNCYSETIDHERVPISALITPRLSNFAAIGTIAF